MVAAVCSADSWRSVFRMLNSASSDRTGADVGVVGDAVAILVVAVDERQRDVAHQRAIAGEILLTRTAPTPNVMIANRSDGCIWLSINF